jgi:hypothetical protein
MSEPRVVLEPVQFGRWVVHCDPVATRRAYDRIGDGSPKPCDCTGCENFNRVREQAYPAAALSLFERLGITPHREAEIFECGPDAGGLYLYGGWYHFVGRLESGGDALVWEIVRPSYGWGRFDLMPVGERFSIGFSEDVGLVQEAFNGYPLVQVEFRTLVPWVHETPFQAQ